MASLPCAGGLDHRIAGVVDEIGVVAGPADHGVGTGAAVEEVVAAVAEDRVCRAVAEALQVGAALQDQGLDVRRQPVVDGGEDRVVALAGILDHLIAGIVDEIGVVAGAAAHGVGAGAAVEEVVAAVAEDRVRQAVAEALQVGSRLAGPGSPRCRQPEVGGRKYRVVALARRSRSPRRRHCRRNRCRCRHRRSWRRRRRRRRGDCCRNCRTSSWPGRCRSPAGRRRPAGPDSPRWPMSA